MDHLLQELPLSEKEQSRLLGLPTGIIRKYNCGIKNLPEDAVKKIDALHKAWEKAQTTKAAASPKFIIEPLVYQNLASRLNTQVLVLELHILNDQAEIQKLQKTHALLRSKSHLIEVLKNTADAGISNTEAFSDIQADILLKERSCEAFVSGLLAQRIEINRKEVIFKRNLVQHLKNSLLQIAANNGKPPTIDIRNSLQ